MPDENAIYENLKLIEVEKGKSGVYSKGKSKGEKWQRYILHFKRGEYIKKITAFAPMGGKSIQVEDMKDGSVYYMGYTPGVQGQKSATAFFISNERTEPVQPNDSPPIEEVDKSTGFKDMIEAFITDYTDNVKPTNRHLPGFVGSFFLQANQGKGTGIQKDLVKKLLSEYKLKVEVVIEEVV